MNTLTFELWGEVPPSKKNAKQTLWRSGRRVIIPSNRYLKWHKTALPVMQESFRRISGPKPDADSKLTVIVTFFPKTKRLWDLTNKAESVLDLLVDAGIIRDDNWSVVPAVNLIFGGVCPAFPKTIIEIHWESNGREERETGRTRQAAGT